MLSDIGIFPEWHFMFSPRLLPLFFLLLGVAARLVRWACEFPLWGDEAFVALNFLDRDFLGFFTPLRHYQIAPLGFLLAEKFCFESFGPGELALRALPCLLGSISLLIFWRALVTLLPWKPTLLALAILCTSYYPIRHACEIKPYAFDLFASCTLLWIFSQQQKNITSTTPWLLLAILTPGLLFLSFPAIFVAMGIWLAMTYSLPKPRKPVWVTLPVITLFLISLTFLLHFQLVATQQFQHEQAKHTAYWDSTFPPANPLKFLFWLLDTHAGNMSAYPVGGKHGASAIQFLLLILGGVFLFKRKAWAVLLALVTPFLFNLIAAALGRYPYGGSARVAQHLAPALCILIAIGLCQILHFLRQYAWQRRLAGVFLTLLAILALTSILRDFNYPFKSPEDLVMKNMVLEVTRNSSQNQPLVITRPQDQLDPGIEWYLRTLPGEVLWMTEKNLPTFVRQHSKALWFWLPARDLGGNLIPDYPPTALDSCTIETRKTYSFPLGRVRHQAMQAQWLELTDTAP